MAGFGSGPKSRLIACPVLVFSFSWTKAADLTHSVSFAEKGLKLWHQNGINYEHSVYLVSAELRNEAEEFSWGTFPSHWIRIIHEDLFFGGFRHPSVNI